MLGRQQAVLPEELAGLVVDRGGAGGAIADAMVGLMEQLDPDSRRLRALDERQQGSFVLDPAHDDVVSGGCAESRACLEARMGYLDRSEARREARADEDIEVRDSSHGDHL